VDRWDKTKVLGFHNKKKRFFKKKTLDLHEKKKKKNRSVLQALWDGRERTTE